MELQILFAGFVIFDGDLLVMDAWWGWNRYISTSLAWFTFLFFLFCLKYHFCIRFDIETGGFICWMWFIGMQMKNQAIRLFLIDAVSQ